MLRLIPALQRLGACLVAITERAGSTLGHAADLCVALGPIEEACPLGLAPSASTTALMAVGDALALLVSRMRDFRAEDFALYHPAGSLGRRLLRVEDVMRTGGKIRRARADETVRAVFVRLAGPRRRSGAVLIEDEAERLLGIFTDSDLARLFEKRREGRPRPADRRGDDGQPDPDPGRSDAGRGGRDAQGTEDQRAAGRRSRRLPGRPDRRDRPDRPGPRRLRGVIIMANVFRVLPAELTVRCGPIELLVLDVDGV